MVTNNDHRLSTDQGNQFNSNSDATGCELNVKHSKFEVCESRRKEKVADDDGRPMSDDHPLPLRHGKEDCEYYMKFGTCKFGMKCKYNHPPKRIDKCVEVGDVENKEQEAYQDKDTNKIECKYYLSPEGCKYGVDCKFVHPKAGTSDEPPEFNLLGLPLHPGEKVCRFYKRTGSCAYGTKCRFHHPDFTPEKLEKIRANLEAIQFKITQSVEGEEDYPLRPGAPNCDYYVKHGTCKYRFACRFNHPKGIILPKDATCKLKKEAAMEMEEYSQNLKGKQDVVAASACGPRKMASNSAGVIEQEASTHTSTLNVMARPFEANQQAEKVDEFPQRPGELDCELYLKTGECKFKSHCRFHHPRGFETKVTIGSCCSFTEKGLPLRSGAEICPKYQMFGLCKYGHRCLYDHPLSPEIPSIAKPPSSRPSSSANIV